jgi:hypothetical protein
MHIDELKIDQDFEEGQEYHTVKRIEKGEVHDPNMIIVN